MIRLIYRGYKRTLISELSKKHNLSPSEMLYLMTELLDSDSTLIHKAALAAQEKQNARSKKGFLHIKN